MKTSNTVENIFAAQIAMQAEMTDIGKDKQGFGYRYASFDSIVQHLRPLLAKHGLGFIQTSTSEEDRIGVTTRLIHKSGEWVEDTFMMNLVTLAKMNNYQVAGSAITYLKRYGLSAIVGIAVDEDIDASGEQPPQTATFKQTLRGKLTECGFSTQDIKDFGELHGVTNSAQADQLMNSKELDKLIKSFHAQPKSA
jgi:hypothetical protein